MIGQYSLFDNDVKRRPCEYSFPRYIGQSVRTLQGIKIIKEIEQFYTIFTDGTVGSPHDMTPIDEEERLEAFRTEMEYQEYLYSKKKDSVSKKNIEILSDLIEEMEENEPITPAQEYYFETGKTTYWQDSQGKPHRWWREREVSE